MNDLERAIQIAVEAYAGQTDKSGDAYIRHPLRVMQEMDTDDERVVAVLHDVVEDADYTLDDIESEFGETVRDAVVAVTRREGESYEAFVDRAAANPIARTVKIADIEDNVDLTRLDELSEDFHEKMQKYHAAWTRLQSA